MSLIKREDAIKAIEEHGKRLSRTWGRKYTKAHEAIVLDCIGALKDIPLAENKGEWIGKGDYEAISVKCSICGRDNGLNASNFCPNCGARMKGADDERL
jgi:hypothetical protein